MYICVYSLLIITPLYQGSEVFIPYKRFQSLADFRKFFTHGHCACPLHRPAHSAKVAPPAGDAQVHL